jgi:hypothetical protein
VATVLNLPTIFLILIGIIFIVTAITTISKNKSPNQSRYQSKGTKYARYEPGTFSPQMELDIRLPYRRFRQIYPHSNLTYQQYKQLQKQRAFKRSRSSQENTRMVR